MHVELSRLTPVDQMRGDDDEDTALLKGMYEKAAAYLRGFKWCRRIAETHFGLGIGGVVAVFLFRIDGPPEVDPLLWVVVGDLPTAYLVTDDAPSPAIALEVYCSLMADNGRLNKARQAALPSVACALAPDRGVARVGVDARLARRHHHTRSPVTGEVSGPLPGPFPRR